MVFVALPVGAIADAVMLWLATGVPLVSDVGSVKGAVVAEVVAGTPDDHDVLVAFVSHVPQLAASTLMDVATTHEAQHRALLRLAAGGFRDMTRIAASQSTIWLDILTSNRDAVLGALDAYVVGLQHARDLVAAGDRDALKGMLNRARTGRRKLPVGISMATKLAELRIAVPDKPGVIAEVTTLASRIGVNRVDLQIAHSKEGRGAERPRLRVQPRGHRVSVDSAIPEVVTIGGAQPLRGRLQIPGEKSISHRALLFAALADGSSTITNLATGADVRGTARVLEQRGVSVSFRGERSVSVQGAGIDAFEPDAILDCENSGTAMRVLAGLLSGRFGSVEDHAHFDPPVVARMR